MGEDDDISLQHVIKHSLLPVNGDLKTPFSVIVGNFVFCLHKFIFIPICDFVNPSFS